MDLRHQICQCFLVGFIGENVSKGCPIAQDILQRNLGGILLFDRNLAQKQKINNIATPEQTRKLIADLQALAGGSLLIAVDQEGGNVSRLKKDRGFPVTDTAGHLGQHSDTSLTRQAAAQTAQLLASLGVNFNLAPVTDLDIFPENPIIGKYQRSFARSPQKVAQHAKVWIHEHHQHNIRCCLKHFPGHGSSRADSHLGFVDITSTWQDEELDPYRQIFADGYCDAVMTGHLFHSNLDPEYPATLSQPIVTGLLRDTLGFSGTIISDDMQMQAITSRYGIEEACWRALAAGIDLLVLGNNLIYDPAILQKCSQAIEQAVRDGRLKVERIDEACANVQKLKQPL